MTTDLEVWLLWRDPTDYDGWPEVADVFAAEALAIAAKDGLDRAALEAANANKKANYDAKVKSRGAWKWDGVLIFSGRATIVAPRRGAPMIARLEDGTEHAATWQPDPTPPEPFEPITELVSQYRIEAKPVRG